MSDQNQQIIQGQEEQIRELKARNTKLLEALTRIWTKTANAVKIPVGLQKDIIALALKAIAEAEDRGNNEK